MTVWWHPKAVLAADFKNGRYGLFAVSKTLADLVGVTRASAHLFADASGVYQTFGTNTLARNDGVGAYIGGAATNLHPYSAAFSSWAANSGITITDDNVTAPDGTLTGDTLTQTAATSIHAALQNGFTVTLGLPYIHDWYVTKTGHRYVQLFVGGPPMPSNAYANFDRQSGSFGTIGADIVASVVDMGNFWWVRGKVIPVSSSSTSTIGVLLVSSTTAARAQSYAGSISNSVGIWGAGFYQSAFPVPHVPTAGAPASRAATLAKAIASGGAPFAGYAASGLATALSARVIVNLSHVGDGVSRPLIELSDGTANNRLRLYIDTDDKPVAAVVSGGVTLASVKLASALSAGRVVLGLNCSVSGGLYLVRQSGLEEASASLSDMPAGLSELRYGSSVTPNYLNDTLEEVQIGQLISASALRDWVQSISDGRLSGALAITDLSASAVAQAAAIANRTLDEMRLTSDAAAGCDGRQAARLDDLGLSAAAATRIRAQVAAILDDARLAAAAALAAQAGLDALLEDTGLQARAARGAPRTARIDLSAICRPRLNLTARVTP